MRWVVRLLSGLILVVAVALWLAPEEPDDLSAQFDEALLSDGVDAYLEGREARVPDLREGAAKRVIWARVPEDRTEWAVVYLHGFSAGPEEIRPVPDRVAEALGANLYFARLTGHGRDGAAMAEASLPHWMGDVAEAMAIGRRIGERVLVLGTSTGGTLATLAAHDPDLSEDVAGLVLISPNYRVKSLSAMILTWPGVRYWGPLLAGAERRFSPQNADHAAHWTTAYPTTALLPMAETVKAARAVPHDRIDTPALFVFSDLDQVVDAGVTRQVASAWGGPVEIMPVDPARTEPAAHVIAGDILSPEMTGPVVARIVDWARALPVAPVSD
ncbi:Thermostable monoacylglycerol lipase [Roseivivax sp. THAF40]|uniref:alpha/beta hydrolase n=1 Tax=unclassified Roseivivax TaxID=2639302 RepID=UPI0012A7FC0E|nr:MULTISPECIES: alpha/beta hydrolase [unclassified Roseivivax]QFS82004.1 Thermostable monoacylglycerol lipase [Roseivivax sp. THAF197b]QFT45804.1 Thermostable monoacylglycerol lipase [Roseivivax sp. THAF40]